MFPTWTDQRHPAGRQEASEAVSLPKTTLLHGDRSKKKTWCFVGFAGFFAQGGCLRKERDYRITMSHLSMLIQSLAYCVHD